MSAARSTLTGGAGLGLGITMLWFSLLVLLPLSAIVARTASGGWDSYITVLQNDQTWAAVILTVRSAAIVTGVPAGVYLATFSSRFVSTWSIRV